jgi:hypothetical protein
MKTKLIALALFAGSALFAETRFSVNIGVGGYGPQYARPYAYAPAPPCPGPGYAWVDGYRGPDRWVAGYWRAPARPVFVRDYRDHDYRDHEYREHEYREHRDYRDRRYDRDDRHDRDHRDRDDRDRERRDFHGR